MKFKNFIIILLIFAVPIIAYAALSRNEASFAKKNMDVNKPKIIKFTSLMCLDCKKLGNVFKEVYPKYSDKITLVEVQVQNNDDFTKKQVEKYNITLVPTIILLNSKGKKLQKIEGFVDKDKLDKLMDKLANE